MKRSGSLQRVTSSSGDPAWLASGHARVKELLGDSRLSRSHPDPGHMVRMTQPALFGGPMGDPETEAADHIRMRRLLTRSFSARRMETLRPRIQAILDDLLDGMQKAGAPADFREFVALGLPILTICELLGVAAQDRADFRRWSDEAAHMSQPARSRAALQSLWRYLGALIERKHASPGEDVVSDLIAATASDPALDDDGIAHICSGLLFAGHGSTVAVIDKGVRLLLAHPDQRDALGREPALATSAVEEILRYPSPDEKPGTEQRRGGLPRYASADIRVDGETIRTGELVMFALDAANLDEQVFADPGRFDVARSTNPHLSFSHGLHFCLGASLARMELQILFGSLFGRFPNLRLGIPESQVRPIRERMGGGAAPLPVAW